MRALIYRTHTSPRAQRNDKDVTTPASFSTGVPHHNGGVVTSINCCYSEGRQGWLVRRSHGGDLPCPLQDARPGGLMQISPLPIRVDPTRDAGQNGCLAPYDLPHRAGHGSRATIWTIHPGAPRCNTAVSMPPWHQSAVP